MSEKKDWFQELIDLPLKIDVKKLDKNDSFDRAVMGLMEYIQKLLKE